VSLGGVRGEGRDFGSPSDCDAATTAAQRLVVSLGRADGRARGTRSPSLVGGQRENIMPRGLFIVVVCCALAGSAQAQAPRYTAAEVSPRPLRLWEAIDLGAQGQVVGRTWDLNASPPLSRGFLWQNGSITLLDGPAGETVTEARCIDNQGVIYGGYSDHRFDPILLKMNPMRWVAGVPTPYTNNQGINSATILGCSPTTGVAVGWAKPFEPGAPGWQGQYGYTNEPAFSDGDPVRAFIWQGATGAVLTRSLGLSGDGAFKVNDAGQAAVNLNGYELGGAAVYDPRFGLARLPGLGVGNPNPGSSTQATGINQSGQIVGFAQTQGAAEHPVRWDHGALTDLGLLPGFVEGSALDINDSGVIVGGLSTQSWPFGVSPTAGFVCIGGVMYDLNQCVPAGAPFVIRNALAINNAGQILVEDPQLFGSRRYAVLTPTR
jgi:probable HAF family extracellular repeat protein